MALRSISAHCLQVGEGTVCDGKSKPNGRDRIVAQCFIDKFDIAEEMVKSGTTRNAGRYDRTGAPTQGVIVWGFPNNRVVFP